MMRTLWALLLTSHAQAAPHTCGDGGLSWSELVHHATAIHAGVVVDARSRETPKGLVTTCVLAVHDTLKGEKTYDLTFELPGGVHPTLGRQRVSGIPACEAGDDFVVLAGGDGRPTLTGILRMEHGLTREGWAMHQGIEPIDVKGIRALVEDEKQVRAEAADAH